MTNADPSVPWEEIAREFIAGKWGTLKEAAESHGVGYSTLRARAHREGWKKRRDRMASIKGMSETERVLADLDSGEIQMDDLLKENARIAYVTLATAMKNPETKYNDRVRIADYLIRMAPPEDPEDLERDLTDDEYEEVRMHFHIIEGIENNGRLQAAFAAAEAPAGGKEEVETGDPVLDRGP